MAAPLYPTGSGPVAAADRTERHAPRRVGAGHVSGVDAMTWEPELDELAERRRLAGQMGGPEGVARQHGRGKLTVRERLPLLADPGTFREFGGLARPGQLRRARAAHRVRPPGSGRGDVPRSTAARSSSPPATSPCAAAPAAARTAASARSSARHERALEWRLPYVRLLDAAGGSVRSFEDLGRTYLPDGNSFTHVDDRAAQRRRRWCRPCWARPPGSARCTRRWPTGT